MSRPDLQPNVVAIRHLILSESLITAPYHANFLNTIFLEVNFVFYELSTNFRKKTCSLFLSFICFMNHFDDTFDGSEKQLRSNCKFAQSDVCVKITGCGPEK